MRTVTITYTLLVLLFAQKISVQQIELKHFNFLSNRIAINFEAGAALSADRFY